jgi:hypothetical protein
MFLPTSFTYNTNDNKYDNKDSTDPTYNGWYMVLDNDISLWQLIRGQ